MALRGPDSFMFIAQMFYNQAEIKYKTKYMYESYSCYKKGGKTSADEW